MVEKLTTFFQAPKPMFKCGRNCGDSSLQFIASISVKGIEGNTYCTGALLNSVYVLT